MIAYDFIALYNYRQAAGKTSAELYLLLLVANEVVVVCNVSANVPITKPSIASRFSVALGWPSKLVAICLSLKKL